MKSDAVELVNLTLGYNGFPVIHNVSGSVRKGSLTAVVGPNGSGKSTLLKGIAGILSPSDGECIIHPPTRIAYLPQLSELDRSFPACVQDIVSLGLWPGRGPFRRHRRQDRQRLSDALAEVGMTGFENQPLAALSGGQLQRALFARVILQGADLILLDEPFNAIDVKTTRDMLALIKRWHAQSRTVVVVIHDMRLVGEHFPETLMINGRVVAWGETLAVLKQGTEYDHADKERIE